MRFLSEGVQRRKLPSSVVNAIVDAAKKQRIKGEGKFCYVPVSIIIADSKRLDCVVSFFYDRVQIRPQIIATDGDVAVNLRSEWNERTHPLD